MINDVDAEPAEATVREVKVMGAEAIACVGSVIADDFGERFIQTALRAFNGIDIIVSNAGYTRDASIRKMGDDQFQEMLDVHLVAPFRILRAAAEPISEFAKREASNGREVIRKVVLISSMAGTHGNAGQVNYSSAKAGLVGMTKTIAKEWGRHKVCVNCVAFGFIDTRLTKSVDDPASSFTIDGNQVRTGVPSSMLDALPAMVPLGRAGTPEEASGAIFMFCGPDSDYVSGQVLEVGGGLSI